MLVLSRTIGEFIDIDLPNGQRVELCIANIKGNKCRIAIKAPREFSIMRRELHGRPSARERAMKGEK